MNETQPFKGLCKKLSGFTLINLLSAISPFLVTMLLTRFLSIEQYGYLGIFQMLMTFLLPLITLNLHEIIGRNYLDKETLDFPACVSSYIMAALVTSLTINLSMFFFSTELTTGLGINTFFLYLAIGCAFLQGLTYHLLTILQMQNKLFLYGVIHISQGFFYLLFVFVYFYFPIVNLSISNWEATVFMYVLAYVLVCMFCIYILLDEKLLSTNVNFSLLKQALSFGIPLIPHTLAMWAIMMGGRYIVKYYFGMGEVGLYVAGFQLGVLMNVLQTPILQTWVPYAFQQLHTNSENTYLTLGKYIYLGCLFLLISATLLSIISHFIIRLFWGSAFYGANIYAALFGFVFAFRGMYSLISVYILYEKKTILLSAITVFTTVLSIIVGFYLMKSYGAVGIAWAMCFAFFTLFMLVWMYSYLHNPAIWSSNNNLFSRKRLAVK